MDDRAEPKPRKRRLPRIADKDRHHPADHPQEILRDALRGTYRNLSPERILQVMADGGFERPFDRKSLKAFIDNETATIAEAHYEVLAEVWLRRAGGRLFRYLDTSDKPEFEKLAHLLASGYQLRPHGTTVTGRFFMYHGSYLAEKSYVIRLIEIGCIDDSILTVTDSLFENFLQHKMLVARGVLTFVKEIPQFLFDADDNKPGLSLIACTGASFNAANELTHITGVVLAVTNPALVAERSCVLIREPEDSAEAMLAQTGIFSRDELRTKAPKHQAAFDALARMPPKRVFVDPMTLYDSPEAAPS